jgi:sugar lactone lactonase YvrE
MTRSTCLISPGGIRSRWTRRTVLSVVLATGSLAAMPAVSQASGSDDVLSVFAGTGSYAAPTPGPATSSALGGPLDVAVDSAGNLYIADYEDDVVEKVTPSGTLSVLAGDGSYGQATPGPATSSDLNGPAGVAVDAAGDVYIADSSNNVVEKVTPGGTLSIVAGNGSSGAPTPGPATSSDLSDPYSVAVDASGDLFISDQGNNRIEKVTPDGTLSIFAGTGAQSSPVPGPATGSGMGDVRGLATDAAGNLYVADDYNEEVEKVTPSGTLSIIAGDGTYGTETPGPALSSMLANPTGMAIDPAGDLYVADSGNYVIEEITPAGTLSVIAGTGTSGSPTAGPPLNSDLAQPNGVALNPAGDAYYIADYGIGVVEKVAPPPPVSTASPTISGDTTAGQTLTASTGTWTESPEIYTYQWQDCDAAGNNCVDISGATASTYTLSATDIGHTLRVAVTAENGGGSATSVSPASGLVNAAPVSAPGTPSTPTSPTTTSPTTTSPTTTSPTTTSPSPTPAADQTSAATGVKGQSASLGGIVAAHASAVSYRFAYGTSTRYGQVTTAHTLAGSLTARIGSLVPGRVYHYRLEVINSAGTISYGADKTLTTPKALPSRVRDHIYFYWDQHAPYSYRVVGRVILPHGLTQHVAYQSPSKTTITATLNGKTIARHIVRVSKTGTYTSTFVFTKRSGSGQISFHMHFSGNHQLKARQARTLNVLYGPNAKH